MFVFSLKIVYKFKTYFYEKYMIPSIKNLNLNSKCHNFRFKNVCKKILFSFKDYNLTYYLIPSLLII